MIFFKDIEISDELQLCLANRDYIYDAYSR